MITKFSILIANYNNGRFFKDCYDSIIAQTYTNWEVIIVDDASTDNSLDLINQLIQGDNRFKFYINEVNGGCGYTKRRCAELATGEICGFLDPDDALMSEALEVMAKVHLEHVTASLLYSNTYFCDEYLNSKLLMKRVLPKNCTYLESGMTITHFASFKLSLYRLTEGINYTLLRAVDQDLYYKCEEVGDIIHVDIELYRYRIHNRGLSTQTNVPKAFAWHIYVILDACKRRNVEFENILCLYLQGNSKEKTLDYKIGSIMLWPLRKLKHFFDFNN